MADGSISMEDGLGLKALDSIEVRRKQNHLQSGNSSHEQLPQLSNDFNLRLEIDNPNTPVSNDFNLRLNSGGLDPTSTSTSTTYGFGPYSPKSSQNPSSSRKLQHVLMEERLKLEAEAPASSHGNVYQLERQSEKVLSSIPTPDLPSNARGYHFVEGDPNLGYPLLDTKPRQNSSLAQPQGAYNPQYHSNSNVHTMPHQPNRGQFKPKPKNWASLLQSQSPSSDMKLGYFPDLQRGKEAQVEIDLELTEVGKWNRYLVGHFLDGIMAYPLLVSTARYKWKDLFVAVKPDVSGFYLFEFKDEQAKLQVLEGGPYFFSQKYLVLKDWHRMMKPLQDQPSKIPAWVKFHDLPLELWNQECFSRVASTVGRPIHVDQATARTSKQPGLLQTKSTIARICIEISADQELPDEVTVSVEGETVVVPIEYQVLPPMCSYCHVFGHSTSKCVMHKVIVPPPPPPPKEQEWKIVHHGKQQGVGLSPPLEHTLTPQNIPSPILSLTSLPDPSSQKEDAEDSEIALLEVLEGVVRSVFQGPSNSHKITTTPSNIDSKLTENTVHEQSNMAANKAGHNGKNPVGADKKEEPPDLMPHAISDIKLMLGGSSKAGNNGKNRSHSKGSSHKRRN